MNELVPDDLMRESILVPCLAEQEVIGNSLSQLDHLITLHQRKRKYRDLYGYLSWEQRKLGELMDVASVRRVHQEDWTDEGVRFLRARDLVAFAKNESIEDPLFISSLPQCHVMNSKRAKNIPSPLKEITCRMLV